jgi:hypothetical protein
LRPPPFLHRTMIRNVHVSQPDCGAIAPAGGAAGSKTAGSGVRSCKVRHGQAPTQTEQDVEASNRAAARKRAFGALVRYECKKHYISPSETDEFVAWAMAGTSPQERAGHSVKLIKFEKVMDHVRFRLRTEPSLLLDFYTQKDKLAQAANVARAAELKLLAEQRAADARFDDEYERALARSSWDEDDEDMVSTRDDSPVVFGDVEKPLSSTFVSPTVGLTDWEPEPLSELMRRVPLTPSPPPVSPLLEKERVADSNVGELPLHAVFKQRNARGNRPGKQQRALRRAILAGLTDGGVIELPVRKVKAPMMHPPIAQIIRHSALARECRATYEEPQSQVRSPPVTPPNSPVVLFPGRNGSKAVLPPVPPQSDLLLVGSVAVPIPRQRAVRCTAVEPRDLEDVGHPDSPLPRQPVTPPARRPPSLPLECQQHRSMIISCPPNYGVLDLLLRLRRAFVEYIRMKFVAFRAGFRIGWNRRRLPRVGCVATEVREVDPPDTVPREPTTSLSTHIRRFVDLVNPFVSFNTWLTRRSVEIAQPTPREGIRAISVTGVAPPRTDEVIKTANALVSSIRPKCPGDMSGFEEAVSNLVRRCKISHSAANDAIILALNSCLDSRERAKRRQEFANADHYRDYLWWLMPRVITTAGAIATTAGTVVSFRRPDPSI